MLRIKLASSAPTTKRLFYKICIPTFRQPLRGIPLSDHYLALWTHWFERSLVCYNTPECPRCRQHVPRRWKGYLPMTDLTRKVLFIAEITPRIGEVLDRLIASQVHLFSLQIKLGRSKDRPNAPQTIEYHDLDSNQLKLPMPKPFDPLPTVLSTLGLTDEEVQTIE